jgi:hypothetical protein
MYEVFWDDEDGYLKIQWHEERAYAHAEIFKWSKANYYKALEIWEATKQELAEQGVDKVFVLIPEDDYKLIKFEKMFGFQPITTHNGVMYMVCSTETE